MDEKERKKRLKNKKYDNMNLINYKVIKECWHFSAERITDDLIIYSYSNRKFV